MKKEAKEKLANVRMYGRMVSEFLLPDQMEFIENAMIEFAQEQANGQSTIHEAALHKHVVNASAWIFDGKDPQGRDISIYIEAPDRESAIAYFETDYEGYRYWQTRQHLR